MLRLLALFSGLFGLAWWFGVNLDWRPQDSSTVILTWEGSYFVLPLFHAAVGACVVVGVIILCAQLVTRQRSLPHRR